MHVFPIENGEFPASHVCWGGIFNKQATVWKALKFVIFACLRRGNILLAISENQTSLKNYFWEKYLRDILEERLMMFEVGTNLLAVSVTYLRSFS